MLDISVGIDMLLSEKIRVLQYSVIYRYHTASSPRQHLSMLVPVKPKSASIKQNKWRHVWRGGINACSPHATHTTVMKRQACKKVRKSITRIKTCVLCKGEMVHIYWKAKFTFYMSWRKQWVGVGSLLCLHCYPEPGYKIPTFTGPSTLKQLTREECLI